MWAALVGAALVTIVFLMRQMRLAANAARLGAELEAAERALDDQRALVAQTQIAAARSVRLAVEGRAQGKPRGFRAERREPARVRCARRSARVQTQLAQVDNAREGSYRAVRSQLVILRDSQEQLRKAADGLTRSLRSPNVRGKWGEIQLKRIVELAGMIEHCDFVEKETATTEDGAVSSRTSSSSCRATTTIVIDSKVPIDAYLAATEAKDATRARRSCSPRTRARCGITSARWARRNTGSSSSRRRNSS